MTQQIIRWPSTVNFKTYIKDSPLQNCNIDIDGINRAEDIYVTPTPIIQMKMKITTPPFVTKHPSLPLPLPIASNHKHAQVFLICFTLTK